MTQKLHQHFEMNVFLRVSLLLLLTRGQRGIYMLTQSKKIHLILFHKQKNYYTEFLFLIQNNKMAAVDDNDNDMDAIDYEDISLYHLYVGNHFDQHYQE
jgi:hypothetical protein